MKLTENLRQNDLQYLISNIISIDQYTSKIDEDNITIALFSQEIDAAEELKDFIEKYYYIEIRDIEISDTLTDDNKYIIFVEVERNVNFPNLIMDIAETISFVTNNKKWKFQTFQMNEPQELTKENINQYVRLNKLRDTSNVDVDADQKDEKSEEIKETFEINDKGWIRKYKPIKYISENELNKHIEKSETLNNRDLSEINLLENAYPEYNVITTDRYVFFINDDKILMCE